MQLFKYKDGSQASTEENEKALTQMRAFLASRIGDSSPCPEVVMNILPKRTCYSGQTCSNCGSAIRQVTDHPTSITFSRYRFWSL
jgi:hypothetical protein